MENFAQAYRRMIDQPPSSFRSWAVFILLWPLSMLFLGGAWLRAGLYRSGVLTGCRVGVPVFSVGNLTVGGTGKTPVVDELARRLLARGLRVAVVSRGYGGRFRGTVGVVSDGTGRLLMSPGDAGDEPCLLARRNPALRVYVARRRISGVRTAESAGAQVVILDDGFQHLAVHRDLDIVLLDARAPFGNGGLLPAGPLREPPGALRRAGVVIMTHAAAGQRSESRFAGPVLHCRHVLGERLTTLSGEELSWSSLAGRQGLAFAGIGRPEDFFAAVRAKGVPLVETFALDDHHDYSHEQLNRLMQSCDNGKFFITTEKDAVKLQAVDFCCPCLVAPLTLCFDESERLDELLTRALAKVK